MSTRASAFLAILVLAGYLPAGVCAGAAGSAARNVVLIGWDGAARARVQEMLARGELPNLKKLSEEGSFAATEVTTGNTQTKPGWAEILTGRSAVKLGIPSNKVYAPIPGGETVFERFTARYGRERGVAIFIAGKADNVGMRGPHQICMNCPTRDPETRLSTNYRRKGDFKGAAENGEDPVWVERAGEPFYNARRGLAVSRLGLGTASNVGRAALDALEKYRGRRFFAFIHFQEPDEHGHRHGEASPQYPWGMKITDAWLGAIVRKLKSLGIYDETVIYVTSDHGMDKGAFFHGKAPHTFLAANGGRKLRAGDRKDVAPTLLEDLGIDVSGIQSPLDGRSLLEKRFAALKVGYFLGGRTAIIMRAREAGEFEAGGVPADLYTRRLREKGYHLLTKDEVYRDRFESKVTGVELLEGLSSGRWDLATIGESSFLAAASAGSPVVAVAALGRDVKERSGHLFALRKGVSISSPEDYRGKLFVSRRAGPGDAAFLLEYLKSEGVDTRGGLLTLARLPASARDKALLPRDKVILVHQVFEDDLEAGLKNGVIDGGFFHLKPFENMRDMLVRGKALHEWADPGMSQALLVCTRDFLRVPANRARLSTFLGVYRARVLRENGLSSRKRAAAGSDRLYALDSPTPGLNYPQYDPSPLVDISLLSKMDAILREHGLVAGPPAKLSDFVDNSLAGAVAEAP